MINKEMSAANAATRRAVAPSDPVIVTAGASSHPAAPRNVATNGIEIVVPPPNAAAAHSNHPTSAIPTEMRSE